MPDTEFVWSMPYKTSASVMPDDYRGHGGFLINFPVRRHSGKDQRIDDRINLQQPHWLQGSIALSDDTAY